MPPQTLPPKPFKSYDQLIEILESRGMVFADKKQAKIKLAQIGYYRLSGFWYPCRKLQRDGNNQVVLSPQTKKPLRKDTFEHTTEFDKVVQLYEFDTHLRQLVLRATTQIEIHLRAVIAHELGYHHPLAYQASEFINPKQLQDYTWQQTQVRNAWREWSSRQQEQVNRSQEDSIVWHRQANRTMPIWVVVEAWDFGTTSKYFEMLKGKYQQRIAQRMGLQNPHPLKNWLKEINTLRNRAAHHTRIWNQEFKYPLPIASNEHFNNHQLSSTELSKMYGMITVLAFLLQSIGTHINWVQQAATLISTKPDLPGCDWPAMGFPANGFPSSSFGIQP